MNLDGSEVMDGTTTEIVKNNLLFLRRMMGKSFLFERSESGINIKSSNRVFIVDYHIPWDIMEALEEEGFLHLSENEDSDDADSSMEIIVLK